MNPFLARARSFASSIAPGIFMIGYIIGTGSVTTMATAGARYGMSLTWALFLSCVFTGIMMVAISRLTIISNQTILYNFKTHIHPAASIFIIIALMVTVVSSIMGVTAIVASVLQEWSKPLTPDGSGLHPILTAALMLGVLYTLFWRGTHDTFIKLLAVMVGFMGVCFLLTMIMVIPDPAEVIRGMVPGIPDTGQPHLVIAGMVGTTMSGVCLVSRSTIVMEKGWGMDDFSTERRDTTISMILTFVLSAAIIASAAGTLHPQGIYIEDAIDMVHTLEPLAGRFAISVFVVGIFCAGMSSIFPNLVMLPWMVSDHMHTARNTKLKIYRILVFLIAASGLTIPIFGGKPVAVMIASQAVSPLAMPMLTGFLIYLINHPKIMGEKRAGLGMNAALGLTFVFSLYMAWIALEGFLGG
ncbi:MAG: Nramp family divalent metal transporter [Bacteroidota bacterium]